MQKHKSKTITGTQLEFVGNDFQAQPSIAGTPKILVSPVENQTAWAVQPRRLPPKTYQLPVAIIPDHRIAGYQC